MARLQQAITSVFDEDGRMTQKKTRAVVVVQNGQLIAESYAPGFDANTEILGWSMTKSLTAVMIGILIRDGLLDLDDTHLFAEWTDERKNIPLRDLLNMQSGLDFSELYGENSDATNMLFQSEEVAQIPLHDPLAYDPGTHWSYSSGTSNLLSLLIRRTLGDDEASWRFPYDSLFHRIDMTQTTLEASESGTYIGSSYCYATPRDWARFGQLMLNQGDWYGDQIIDSSFVDFVKTPAAHSNGIYGGHFWLNVDHAAYPDVSTDLFSCNGYEGQYVFIIPSYDLVVVRMGLAEEPWFHPNDFLREVIGSMTEDTQTRIIGF